MTWSAGTACAVSIARRSNEIPRNLSSCLGWPMRLEPPAARMTAASTEPLHGRGDGSRSLLLDLRREFAVLGRDHLRQNGHADLFGRLGADVETDRPVQPRELFVGQTGGLQPFAAFALCLGTA